MHVAVGIAETLDFGQPHYCWDEERMDVDDHHVAVMSCCC
jgi:hypothetical protein